MILESSLKSKQNGLYLSEPIEEHGKFDIQYYTTRGLQHVAQDLPVVCHLLAFQKGQRECK